MSNQRYEISLPFAKSKKTTGIRRNEFCSQDAIVARTALGGNRNLQVDKLVCTGCGMCVATCPVDEITLECLA